jgi:hypothetical protein
MKALRGMNRIGVWGLICGSLVASPLAAQSGTPGPPPEITGPIPGRAFFSTSMDLSAHGYVEEEFFLEGVARSYDLTAGEPLRALDGLHPYKTRVMVRRPVEPDRFNGTVLVEWLNVTVGYDIDVDWIQAREHILRSGYAWVGVSAQRAGVHASGTGLRDWSSERYGTLDLTADSTLLQDELAYDVFTQAAAAASGSAPGRLLGPASPRLVLATGHSQSANRLSAYHDRVHPISRVIDGFLLHGGGGRLALDVDAKVFKINAETDLRAMGQAARRQADSDDLRTWEVAGTSHVDEYYIAHLAELQRRDLGAALTVACDEPAKSRIPFRYALHAAYDHLTAWVADGTPPPRAPPIDILRFEPEIRLVRDSLGNATRGIQLPDHAVPVALNSGRNSGGRFCGFYGTHRPFDSVTLSRLYPSPGAYAAAFTAAIRESLEAGYIVQRDAQRMLRDLSAHQDARAEVERVVRVFFDSSVARFDYDLLDRMVTPDAQFVEGGRFMDVSGFKEFMGRYERRATVRYALSDLRTRIRDGVAWTSFRNRGALTMDGTTRAREWHEAVVLVRRDERWLIDLIHSRPISP